MTVREIALFTASVLQADDIETALADTENPAEGDADVRALVKCVNLAAAELVSDFPVLKTLEVDCADGVIPLDAFAGAVASVREVKCGDGFVRFAFDSRGVRVAQNGKLTVVYTVVPTDAEIDDELAVGAGVDREMLTYLSARNYCLVTGRTDEASVWDQRYNAEAENKRLRRRARLPSRRWIE